MADKTEVINDLIAVERERSVQIADLNKITSVSYETFFQKHLFQNRPCLFCPDATEKWPSRNDWVCDKTPNFGFFERLGPTIVPVANCKHEQFFTHPKQDMTLTEYIDYWQSYKENGYPDDESCLYLKDWHFTKIFPDYKAYTTPIYFQSDWLNEFWDTEPGGDDYRFVYMGPKGTWTPFHADVYRSYSWSANICGRKLWIFYPPGAEEQFRDRFGNLAYDVTAPELEDKKKYPNYLKGDDHRLEITQEQGQIIFVPSGWHHQVYNLEDTISINHNWLNGCNIDICWQHLKDNLESVKKEISDCKDMERWHDQCQLILKASAGIDYRMFFKLLKTVAENRLKRLKHSNFYDATSEDNGCEAEVLSCVEKNSPCNKVWNKPNKSVSDSMNSNEDRVHSLKNDMKQVDGLMTDEDLSECLVDGSEKNKLKKFPSNLLDNSDDKKISDIFRTMNLHPKHPEDKDHTIFDLHRLVAVLKQLIDDADYRFISTKEELILTEQLLIMIQEVL